MDLNCYLNFKVAAVFEIELKYKNFKAHNLIHVA
jgi:hypothetical protein